MNEITYINHIPPEVLSPILELVGNDRVMSHTCSSWRFIIDSKYERLFNRILKRCSKEDRKLIELHASGQTNYFAKISALRLMWPMKGFNPNDSGEWAEHIQTCLESDRTGIHKISGIIAKHHGKFKPKKVPFKEMLKKAQQQLKIDSVLASVDILSSIQVLDLNTSGLFELPESIKLLRKLKELNLFQNNLSTLPDEIGSLKELQKLDVSFNIIESLPKSMMQMKSLEVFDLEGNKLDELPEHLSKMKKWEQLKIIFDSVSTFQITE